MTERVCTTCVFCLRQDTGYSNWTVMNTYLHCMLGLNPALDSQEDPWGEPDPKLAAALDVAQQCSKYREGVPVQLDVDHDGMGDRVDNKYVPESVTAYAEDSEVVIALVNWLNRE